MELANLWKWYKNYDIKNYTLVVPSVAVGNLGQLTCDLLIATLGMERLASIYTPALIPLVGCDPYDSFSTTLSSSCELYVATSHDLLVLQIRAPLIKKYARIFLEHFIDTLQQKQIKDIIILSSSFACENKHIMTSPFRYIASDCTPLKEMIEELELIPHEQEGNDLKIYGGGYAVLLYKICEEKSLPRLCLYRYCSEGDNILDAYDMVDQFQELFPIFDRLKDLIAQVIQPASWKLLFGRPPPQEIY